MEENKLETKLDEIIKLLKASNERQFRDVKQEEKATHDKNSLYRTGAYRIEDYVVRNTMNTIITDMFNGFSEGERHTRLVEQCGRIIYNVERKRLTETNGKLLLYHTAMNCTPPYDNEKEIVNIWNSIMND